MDQQQKKRSRIEPLYLFSTTKVPSAYICPVSWRIMSDPVLDPGDPEGRALEREAFEAHQRQYGVRPLTGLPAIPPSHLRTLVTLQKSICHFIADEQDTSQQQPPAKRARLNEQHMPCPVPAVPVPVGTGQGSAGAAGRPVLNLAAESEVPAPFFCPISRCLMVDPVISRRDQGASLERAAAEEHMALYGTNPLTGEPMSASDLIPDNNVRSVINRWLAKHSGPQLILHTRPAAAGDEDGGADADAAAAAGLGAAAPAAAAPLSLLPAPPPAAAAATAAVAEAPSAAAAAGSLPSNSPGQQPLPPHQPQQEQQQQQQPMQHGHRPPVPPGREPSSGGAGSAGVTAAPPGSEVATVNANASTGTASLQARAGPGGPTSSGEPPSFAHAPGSVPPRSARKMARQMRTPSFPRSTGLGHPTSVVPEQPRVAAGAGPGPSQAQAPGSQARVPIKIEADEADQAAQRLVGSHANGGGGRPPPPQDERMEEEEADEAGGGTGGSGSADDGTAASADGGPPRSEVMDLVSSDTSAAETGGGAAGGGGGGSGHMGSGALVAAGACTSAGAAAAPAAGNGGVAMGPGPRQGRVRRTARWCLTAPVPLAARGAAAPGIGTRAPAGSEPAGPDTGGAAPGAAAVAPSHAGAAGAGASASGSGDAAFEDEDGGGAAADEADGEDARAAADALEEAGPTIGRVRIYYTNEELEALVAGVEAYGSNRWTEIKATNPQLSKRTESALLQKWTMLLKAASTRWSRGCTDLPPQLRARVSAMLSNEAKDSGAAAGAGAGDAGGGTPQGDAGPEQQQQHAVARGGSAGKVVRYTEQEMEAMLDGILKHGCRWKVIMQQNAAVLGGRNELSLKAKWDSLRAWAAEGWPARKQEPPSERIRGKVAAVLAMMNQQQVASSPRRPYVYRKGLPLEVSSEPVEAMVQASGRRNTVTVQVRLDGVTLPGVHSASIRMFASRGRHLLLNCSSLRDALVDKQIVAWRRSSTEDDGFLVEAVSAGGPPMAERDAAADGEGGSDDVDDGRDNGGKGGADALSDDDEGDEEEGDGELGGVCDGDGGDEDDNGRGDGAGGGDGEREASGSEHGSG